MLKKCLRNKNFILGSCMVGLMVLIMVVGFFYMPYDPDVMDTEHELQFFSAAHPLGTDQFGRDILSRIMEGTRVSFLVGALTVVFGLLVGGAVGAVAGYYGGKIDEVIMKLIDTQMAFPGVLLALMLIAVFGNSLQNLIFALGIMSIPRFARITRSGFIKYRDAEFIKAARSRGAGDGRIIFLHILPNIVPELIVTSSLGFAGAVMSEAGLSYLGLGIQPPTPSFGKMLSEAQAEILQAGWYVLVPAAAITLLVMGFNLIGDALQEVTQHGR
ncbi:MAG TPA: ABC transporter permease [Candidatus Acutalibacter ornithocaccae]|uniref:ABC transporter permease n=1 Tax=Candidatus Acutalibacter ornithocaccae TaxID=2838416 RepID=A0A9D2RXI2_9FIRM|nr:ABC transporter permease [Candidatus Acutalibacter ornithocaccae]